MSINAFIEAENGMYGTNLEMLKNLFVQEHFWTVGFLACLFLVEILYYIIFKLCKGRQIFWTIVILIISTIGLLRYRVGAGSLPWNLDVALVAVLFFHIGYLFKKNKQFGELLSNEKNRKMWLIATIFFLTNLMMGVFNIKVARESLDMSVGLYGNEILKILSACAGILGTVVVAKCISNKYLTYLGRNTMIIFAWHSRIVIVLCQYI